MADVRDWLTLLDDWYPPSSAEEWDNSGLQVGSRSWPAERVMVALDPTVAVVEEAAEKRCGLLVTHHPLLFRPMSRVDLEEPGGAAIAAAMAGRVAVMACHTNTDVASPGVTDVLAEVLDLDVTGILAETTDGEGVNEEVPYDVFPLASRGGFGLGRLASPRGPVTAAELSERCAEGLGATARLAGDPSRRVETVALCGGSGASLIPSALRAKADVYVTGDVKHHQALDAVAAGLTVIDAGHHATELPFVAHLAQRLENAGLGEVLVSELSTDPFGPR
jgi:dinuclear metal center YbgI/SA1388 family protein